MAVSRASATNSFTFDAFMVKNAAFASRLNNRDDEWTIVLVRHAIGKVIGMCRLLLLYRTRTLIGTS